jgi:DNA-directed RNA polymerase subunit beta'
MGMILDVPMQQLERIIYFAAYIITQTNEEARKKVLEEIEREYKQKVKSQKGKAAEPPSEKKLSGKNRKPKTKGQAKGQDRKLKVALKELEEMRNRARQEVLSLKPLEILSEMEYHEFSLKYGEVFEAGTGAETLRKIFEKTDLKKEISNIKTQLEKTSPQNRKKVLRRLKIFQGMEKARVRPEWMFLQVLPILPPDLRPMVQLDGGRYASSDLNDLYRRVINRNNRLKYLLEISAPEVIVRNEKRMLQEAVDALIDNGMRKGQTIQATTGGKRLLKSLADMLKGKQGRFRQNLLGKRVDYSGRSVIVVGPELRMDQCGLPKRMALELFKPFVIKRILDKELAYNVRGASRLIEEETDEVWAILEEVVENKLVLLNRAPTLHRLGIQAFQPVLIEGASIRIHPMVCKAFNADFDGDQMAVHLPLSEKSQKESKEIMLSTLNLLKPAVGTPIVTLYQDISLGCYWLTKIREAAKGEGKIFGSPEEAILTQDFGEVDLKAKIKAKNVKGKDKNEFLETSVGRIIFNRALPEGFPFQNSVIRVKDLERITREIIEKYGIEEVERTLDKIKELGFEYSTLSGLSWGIDDLIIPPEKPKIIEAAEKEVATVEEYSRKGLLSGEEKTSRVIEIWTKAKSEIEKLVPKTLPEDGPVFTFIDAGARGSWSQPVQMSGMKGLVSNPMGQTIELPVKNSFKEGFDILEYFISTHGARKGTVDTALRTSTAGYLTRRLVDVAHEMVIFEEDCGDQEGTEILREDAEEIGQNFVFKIVGRVAAEKIQKETDKGVVKNSESKTQIVKNGEIIDWKAAEKIVEAHIKKVKVRSPLSCKSARGICQKCYGWDPGNNQLVKLGQAVGIVAAQAIGEPGTQLTMRTFHTGGVAGGGDITSGLPRVQEIFEVREPRGKAQISQAEGRVSEITPERVIKIKAETLSRSKSQKEQGNPLLNFIRGKKTKEKESEVVEYQIPPKMAIRVQAGDFVKKGQQLCEGNLDIRELFKLVGDKDTQRYIAKEVQRIYVSQGAIIHDKHIEVIVRQMFSRLKIKDPGASYFTNGEIVDRAKFLEENAALKKERKKPAKGVSTLLGISQVALSTDSFLSAASFQETSRVLIRAAIEGKEDKLRGLKENVIIGKLIPVGTGFDK